MTTQDVLSPESPINTIHASKALSPQKIVEDFIAAWNRCDVNAALDLLTEDIIYHNIPMQALNGKEEVMGFLVALGQPEQIDWVTHHIAANGNVVLTERTDNFHYGEKLMSIRVMGTFEIQGQKIAQWRDYFDMAQFQEQLGAIS